MSSLTGPVLAEYQDLFSTSTTAGGPNGGLNLGAKAYTGDGREYRFVLAGATALVPGTLQQNSAEVTGLENLAVTAAPIGATSLTVTTSSTATLNQLAQGYVIVTTSAGAGYQYKIKANSAVSSAVGLVVTLEDPLLIALTTGSRVDLIPNPYTGVIINPSTASGAPIGVAVFPVTAAQYGWIQVAGVANILSDAGTAVGLAVVASNATPGAVETLTGTQAPVGTAVTGVSTTEYGSFKLQIE